MFDIIGKRFWFFSISGIMILASIVSLAVFGLEPGVEFTSGSEMTVSFEPQVDKPQITQALTDLGYGAGTTVVRQSGKDFIIDLPQLDNKAKQALTDGLTGKLGKVTVGEFDTVSPVVAAETTRNALIAIAVTAVGILLYLSWAFRKMPNPFHYGTCAVIALAHDILVVVGIFSILGAMFGWTIDLMFVTGILAVLGFSDNNIVVIFDRIRENSLKSRGTDFGIVVNNSVVETMVRSLNTNLTVIFPLVVLLLIVGASIQNLLVVLLAGIIVGTYDSVFVAPALLVVWQNNEWGRFIGRKPRLAGEAKGR